jgi:ABC-type protease/lipase transport system fused ATPase/permease subunit
MQDLSTIQGFLSSQMPSSLLDLPWTPLFCVILFVLHPALGLFSIAAALVLAGLTLGNEMATKSRQDAAQTAKADADILGEAMRRNAEALHGLGMISSLLGEWKTHRRKALNASMTVSGRSGALTAATKSLRLLLQSGMLGLGALLSIQGSITPGMMIAGTILMGRALAPIEQTIAQWAAIQQAYAAWTRIKQPLSQLVPEKDAVRLSAPIGRVSVSNLAVMAPAPAPPPGPPPRRSAPAPRLDAAG